MVPDFDDVPDTGTAIQPLVSPLGRVEARLSSIEARLSSIETIEAERTGASKLTSKLLAVFGGVGTAIALAMAGLMWTGNAADATRDAEVVQLDEDVGEHSIKLVSVERDARALERRVDVLGATQVEVSRRLNRQAEQLDGLPRPPATPRRR